MYNEFDFLQSLILFPNIIGFHSTQGNDVACHQEPLTPSLHLVLSHLGLVYVSVLRQVFQKVITSADFEISYTPGTCIFPFFKRRRRRYLGYSEVGRPYCCPIGPKNTNLEEDMISCFLDKSFVKSRSAVSEMKPKIPQPIKDRAAISFLRSVRKTQTW